MLPEPLPSVGSHGLWSSKHSTQKRLPWQSIWGATPLGDQALVSLSHILEVEPVWGRWGVWCWDGQC